MENPPIVEFYGFRLDGPTVSRNMATFNTLNDCHKMLTGRDTEEYIATCTIDLRTVHFFGVGNTPVSGHQVETTMGPTSGWKFKASSTPLERMLSLLHDGAVWLTDNIY